MNSQAKRIILFIFGAALVAAIGTSCNTTKGVGKDVEKLGDKIQDKASR
jgi:predicted small secreted protein